MGYLTGKRDTSHFIKLGDVDDLAADEAPAKRPRIDASAAAAPAPDAAVEQSALRTIIANERQLRDRNTMLSVPGRSFQRVLAILDGAVQEEASREARRRQQEDYKRQKEEEARRKQTTAPQPSGRYQRETAPEAGLQRIGAQNLGLQQVGFAAGPVDPSRPSGGAPPPPPPAYVKAPQVPAPPPPEDSRQQQQQRQSQQHRPSSGSDRKSGGPTSSNHHQQHRQQQPVRNLTPIIMVPPAATAMINMLNAPSFLEGGVYQTAEQAAAAGAHHPEKGYLKLTRNVGGKKVHYHVTDKEPKKPEDWERVVGVFCLGKPWQFKKFPFRGASSGDLVDTFQKVCGFYLHYTDEPLDPQVKKWNVKFIKIGRHSRDGDPDAAREFWTHLDGFLKSHNKRNFGL